MISYTLLTILVLVLKLANGRIYHTKMSHPSCTVSKHFFGCKAKLMFDEAERFCIKHGAKLATIYNSEQEVEASNLCMKLSEHNYNNYGYCWFGLQTRYNRYYWKHGYSSYRPKHYIRSWSNTRKCFVIHVQKNKNDTFHIWYPRNCYKRLSSTSFICNKPKNFNEQKFRQSLTHHFGYHNYHTTRKPYHVVFDHHHPYTTYSYSHYYGHRYYTSYHPNYSHQRYNYYGYNNYNNRYHHQYYQYRNSNFHYFWPVILFSFIFSFVITFCICSQMRKRRNIQRQLQIGNLQSSQNLQKVPKQQNLEFKEGELDQQFIPQKDNANGNNDIDVTVAVYQDPEVIKALTQAN